MSLIDCRILELPTISDPRGNLTFIESNRHIPFEIRRVYYIYEIPLGSERGGHAHKVLQQLVVAVSGSFDVHLDDGLKTKTVRLNNGNQGLYISPMIWREITNFSTGATCMVLASNFYDEGDYHRDYGEFIKSANLLQTR